MVRHGVPVVGVMGNNGIWALEKHPMEFLYGYSVAADLQPGLPLRRGGRGARRARRARGAPGGPAAGAGARVRVRQARARERAHRSGGRLPPQVEPGRGPTLAAANLRPAASSVDRGLASYGLPASLPGLVFATSSALLTRPTRAARGSRGRRTASARRPGRRGSRARAPPPRTSSSSPVRSPSSPPVNMSISSRQLRGDLLHARGLTAAVPFSFSARARRDQLLPVAVELVVLLVAERPAPLVDLLELVGRVVLLEHRHGLDRLLRVNLRRPRNRRLAASSVARGLASYGLPASRHAWFSPTRVNPRADAL